MQSRLTKSLVAAALVLLLSGTTGRPVQAADGYKLIGTEELKTWMKSSAPPTLIYSLHMDYNGLPDDKILVLYDIRAKQAPAAIRYLLKKRFYFINLTYLEGGISTWKEQGLPMASP